LEPEKAFSLVLKELRKKHRLSQERLADLCQLDRTFISLLERGKRQPSLSTIITIANCFDIAPSTMMKKIESHLNEIQQD